MEKVDLIVVGAGLAGLMAAIEAKSKGVEKIIIIEREEEAGGAISSCVHSGVHYKDMRENITIPELISILNREVGELGINVKYSTTALKIKGNNIEIVNSEEGITNIQGDAVILATGARERPFGYKNVLRYGGMAGIFTSCAVLDYINKKGVLPGRRCVVLGSDDIGILVAKTLVLEGAKVERVVETSRSIRAKSLGAVEDIEDFKIPINLKHRVVKVYGKSRVTGVDIVQIDDNYKTIEGTKEHVECDTLALCMQLKPDSNLAKEYSLNIDEETEKIIVSEELETSKKGIFACGAVINGYSYVEDVMKEGKKAGKNAAKYLLTK